MYRNVQLCGHLFQGPRSALPGFAQRLLNKFGRASQFLHLLLSFRGESLAGKRGRQLFCRGGSEDGSSLGESKNGAGYSELSKRDSLNRELRREWQYDNGARGVETSRPTILRVVCMAANAVHRQHAVHYRSPRNPRARTPARPHGTSSPEWSARPHSGRTATGASCATRTSRCRAGCRNPLRLTAVPMARSTSGGGLATKVSRGFVLLRFPGARVAARCRRMPAASLSLILDRRIEVRPLIQQDAQAGPLA